MSSDQQRPWPGTRDQIPVIALRLFAEKGYEATSMREIAEQLGITKPALYYHFDSKEEIVRELYAGMHSQVSELVSWAKSQGDSDATRDEVIARWSGIMHAHGLAMFRFLVADGHLFQNAGPDRLGMRELLRELITILTRPGASVEEQLRTRLALMTIIMSGIAGSGLDASEAEILTATRKIATELLPRQG